MGVLHEHERPSLPPRLGRQGHLPIFANRLLWPLPCSVTEGDGQRRRLAEAEPPPTIRDIAEIAGVAISTVSRALSNPGRVNARTRSRVEAIAAELNYVPSSNGRALRSGRTNRVALLVPDVTNPFYFDLIRATQRELKAAGYTQILVDTEESADAEADAFRMLRSSVDGFILAASRLEDHALTERAATVPFVIINRTSPRVPQVLIDSLDGYRQVLEHLYSLGHRRFAYVGPSDSWMSDQRWNALEQKAQELDMIAVQVSGFNPLFTSGAAAGDAFLRTGATACLASNDLLAIGILKRFQERGIRVPEDVSIVGCDDTFAAIICHPPLTTITEPIEEAGRLATLMLLSRLRSDRKTGIRDHIVLPTHLTVRGTTGPCTQEARDKGGPS